LGAAHAVLPSNPSSTTTVHLFIVHLLGFAKLASMRLARYS
jgi:hypothetical protein